MKDAARLLKEQDASGEAALSALSEQGQREVLLHVARYWRDDRPETALELVMRVLRSQPHDPAALRLAAELQREAGDLDAAARLLETLCESSPREEALALEWADVLIEADRAEEALRAIEPFREGAGPLVLLRVGKALFATEQGEEALEVLQHAVDMADAIGRSDPFGGDITIGDPQFAELRALHEEVLAEVHGREAVTVDAALRRRLDARAGVNFKLLAASLMKSRPAPAHSLELLSIAEERAAGKALIASNREDPRGHILLGSSLFRDGEFSSALPHFERAEQCRPAHFAAVLGKGAALEAREHRADSVIVQRLPKGDDASIWTKVVPELPKLSPTERRVVAASLAPLRPLLPRLEAAGAYVRILPIDALATDIPEFAGARDERHANDHRSFDCITGMAHGNVAVVKVEELLDVSSAGGWTFAHELAHVVLEVSPQEFWDEVERLYDRLADAGFVGSEYQMSNVHEFFACGYADFLRERYGTTTYVEHDDEGLLRELFGFFERLGHQAGAATGPR